MRALNSMKDILSIVGEMAMLIFMLVLFPFYYLFKKLSCAIKKG